MCAACSLKHSLQLVALLQPVSSCELVNSHLLLASCNCQRHFFLKGNQLVQAHDGNDVHLDASKAVAGTWQPRRSSRRHQCSGMHQCAFQLQDWSGSVFGAKFLNTMDINIEHEHAGVANWAIWVQLFSAHGATAVLEV